MKKVITLILVLVVTCSCFLAGCNSSETEEARSPYILPQLTELSEESSPYNRANVTVEGDSENSKENISVEEAWNIANTILDKDVTVTLLNTWMTYYDTESGTYFGKGVGFKNGYMCPVDRSSKTSKLTLDLNGYKIYRCTDSVSIDGQIYSKATEDGRIFELRKDGIFTIKNGTIIGACCSKEGGAFWIDNNETTVNLENLTITQNFAHGNGGAIYCKDCDATLNIKDCTITDNTSDNYGGAIYVYLKRKDVTVNLSGTTIIKDNYGKDNRNNITLRGTWDGSVKLGNIVGLYDDSEIYISYSNMSGGQFCPYMTEDQAYYLVDVFYYDTDKYQTKTGCSYAKWYLQFK